MTDQHLVLTPEKTVLAYRLGGLGTRVSAHAIDLLAVITLAMLFNTGLGLLAPVIGPEAVQGIGTLGTFVVILSYFVLLEGLWRGLTLGKRAVGLRVTMADGTPITFAAALYRNLLRLADFLPALYVLGFIVIFTNPRSQRLGDLGAGTIVVVEPKFDASFTPAPHRVGLHPLEETVPGLERMTMAEYHAIKRLCDRFPALPAETQVQSIGEIWRPFAERHRIADLPGVHPVYQMEAVVMKFGRMHNLV